MSVVLVCLPNAPQVSEEAVKRDAEVDKYLESRVEGEKRKSSVVRHTIPILSYSRTNSSKRLNQSKTGLKHCPL